MIDREHDLAITKQAEVLRISRGSVHYLPRRRNAAQYHRAHPLPGWSSSFASVNTIAIRVVSAATTNGPRSFRSFDFAFGNFLICRLVWYF
jgi:hypothetical protein